LPEGCGKCDVRCDHCRDASNNEEQSVNALTWTHLRGWQIIQSQFENVKTFCS